MDSLWKKESNAAGEFYVNIFDRDDVYDIIFKKLNFPNAKTNKKSDITSEKIRIEGNKKFEEKKWSEAVELYNQSLRYAEASKPVALAYANRSACFFELKMYVKCVVDVELAIEANYPKRLMPKLEERRRICLETLKQADEPVEPVVYVPTLSFPPDAEFPAIASVLKIDCNDEFGRCVIANCDIDVGQTVLVEEIFSSGNRTESTTVCETCSKEMTNLIPCAHCTDEMFCVSCESNNFHDFVKDEGTCNKNIRHEYQWLFSAVKMFPIEELMKFVENSLNEREKQIPQAINDMMSKLREFFKLNIYISPKKQKPLMCLAATHYCEISKLKSIKNIFREENQKNFLMHLILYHTFVFHSNGFSRKNDSGLFVIASYFNHSCSPNVAFTDSGNYRIGTVLRPIKRGQQLFGTYLGEDRRAQPKFFRQSYLRDMFGFRCQCEKCNNEFIPRLSSLEREPSYYALEKEFAKWPITKRESFELREKSIKLLNKFGETESWSAEFENVTKVYRTSTYEIFN